VVRVECLSRREALVTLLIDLGRVDEANALLETSSDMLRSITSGFVTHTAARRLHQVVLEMAEDYLDLGQSGRAAQMKSLAVIVRTRVEHPLAP
jgi:hypothetical protein